MIALSFCSWLLELEYGGLLVVLFDPIIGCFLRDLDVVRVALAQAGAGLADETRFDWKFGDRCRAEVSHSGAQAANELIKMSGDRAGVRHAAFDSFGNQLVGRRAFLSVTGGAAVDHCAQRAHA